MSAAGISGGTTPFPNRLLDEAMPLLRDTEWRLLCVVVRQTLGRQADDGGRRERDWLTHSQLKRRTGRASAAVSAAVDGLVRRGLLEVADGRGRPLSERVQRRGAYTRLYFRLARETDGGLGPALSRTGGCREEGQVARPSLESGNSKAKTTKESGTKLRKAQESSETEDAGLKTPEVQSFLEAFRERYRRERPREEMPAPSNADLRSLEADIERFGLEGLSARLPRFFASDFGYVRRRGYSLGSFLSTTHLAALKETRTEPSPGKSAGPR